MTKFSRIRTALASASLAAIALSGSVLYAQDDKKLEEQAGPAPEALYAGTEKGVVDLYHLAPIPAYTPGKTAWGDPDFRGTWPIDSLGGLNLQRTAAQGNRVYLTDEEFAQREARMEQSREAASAETNANKLGMGNWVEMTGAGRRTSLLVSPENGQLPPFTEYAKQQMKIGRSSWVAGQTYDWVTDFDSWDRCVTRGFPASMFPFRYNNGVRIYQAPGYVVIDLEMIHDSRIIPIVKDKASVKHNPANVKEWMGDSVGYWEGNTLVIETTNIQPGASPLNMATIGAPPNNVIPTTDAAKSVERLTMAGHDTLVYEITYSDPKVWTAPWTVRMDIPRNDSYEFYEYACHEGDVQVRNYINSSRALRGTDAAQKEGEESAAN
ncbi:MAG: hypothetical protein P0Y56_07670 [Candidatus Andeanibacterium colombiense]|uniref:Uncharacterized protein n=1 Tax=Candidatus Andeanibacterium colombiense TaxID=3121345 RepID=A0AAJ5X8S4_9SPHN|nr:MAG: hypothetical protein P0Y56_07670 [Sphingomonadaceae bacterium]